MATPRESRSDREIRVALEHFCEVRHHPEPILRWLAWIDLRSLLEEWDREDRVEDFGAKQLVMEGARWGHGWRPPTSMAGGLAMAKRQRRAGILRITGGGI